jgi:glycosyltransferase involved in cell wall biosynthesis
MKVAVEIPYYAYGARGASRYGEYLVKGLGRSCPDDRFAVVNYFYGDHDRHLARLEPLRGPNVDLLVPRWPQRLVDLAERGLNWPVVEEKLVGPWGAEVFHHMGTHPVGATPAVITFFGAAMDFFSGFDAFFLERVLPQLLKASRVIAVSHCLRDTLLKYFPLDPKRVEMVYFGVDHDRFKPRPLGPAHEAARKKHGLPERFLLSVGPFQFRDNLEHLVRVLKDAPELAGVGLALAGGLEEYGGRLRDFVSANGMQDRVRFLGFVPHEELALLFNLCEAFVHCSYYEELGLQMLEACASGCAIVAPQVAGIPEACGEGAAYFNPTRLVELRDALVGLCGSAARRQELGGKALEHSRRFDWDDAARRTREVYAAAAREGNAR